LKVAADLTYETTEVGLGDEKAGGLLCTTNFAQSESTGAETIRTFDSDELVRGTIRMRRDDFGALFRGRSAHFLAFGWRGGLRQPCLTARHARRRAENLTLFRGKNVPVLDFVREISGTDPFIWRIYFGRIYRSTSGEIVKSNFVPFSPKVVQISLSLSLSPSISLSLSLSLPLGFSLSLKIYSSTSSLHRCFSSSEDLQ
ncbi:hypothetical protein T484DRAFT_1646052, partial [Baffinella frigidus]